MHLVFAALLLQHWLVASDLHVEPGRGGPEPSYYASDSNWALFDSTIAQMRKADPNPQVVILTGDFLAHQFPNNVPLAESTMARIARSMNAAFPHAQFVIVPGNNDDPCGDYRVTPGTPYFAYIARLWEPLVNRNGAAPHFQHDFAQYGWYTARLPLPHAQAIALDTVYWSIVYRRCNNVRADAPTREVTWLKETLAEMSAQDRALIAMHIPPGVDPRATLITHRLLVVPFWHEAPSTAFMRTLQEQQQHVGFVLAGHLHRNDFRVLGNVPILIAPSVSPIYGNNPAFLRLDVASDGTLRDYQPFYYDEWSGTWNAEQSFDQTFHVPEFSATALIDLHQRLATDAGLRERWLRDFVAGARLQRSDPQPKSWRTWWCAQTQTGSAYVSCAGLRDRVAVLPIAAGIFVAAVLAMLAYLAVRLARQRPAR